MAVTLIQAHAMAMILSMMTFGSTGIIIARYGRSLRFGTYKQLLGKAVWFQIHRFFLSISSLLILTGFLFILVWAGGQWVDPQRLGLRLFAHSIMGGTIVCCAMIQIWLTLYRCNPNSRFRFIFDWSHRIVGLLAFILSIPTIFLALSLMRKYHIALVTIISIWAVWIVMVVMICEKIEHKRRVSAAAMANNIQQCDRNQETMNTNIRPDIEAGTHTTVVNQYHNQIKLLLFLIHFIISITLSILLIVFI
ncbi:unnamed protein product [Rotaria magnacalcarata]|uniref:ascorbate ferrireductase (transmembrane) n=1 Tax=Rotaria magnacalcarata TaxID=392030 RepID=A0A815FEZ0_9BILA|nr:unnamed protein product [Rotaria magnacalcarata]CAF1537459.1 unnamed protein product [Rotaria magnacalcarata]CAF2032263.1 unnamed protein product [Rotaria magnacalcarata]CAF2108575.1 unnamed protein product [Rotaria magnacalcarata]CAF2124936.1 unnamed protein product [Rotaria magnacalcarata]